MSITRIESDQRMSQAVVHGTTVYLSGQVGEHGGTVAEQTAQALAEIDRLLTEVGSCRSKILFTQIWLANIETFEDMNQVWDAWIPEGAAPARATGESRLAAPEYLVEIIVTATR